MENKVAKQVLIVVDYQKDFVDGALGFKKAAQLDTGIAAEMIKYISEGGYVINTFDTHDKNYLNTQEGKNLPIEHCIRDTDGWNLYGAVKDVHDKFSGYDHIIDVKKATFGSISLIGALDTISNYGEDPVEIRICGVVTNMCVISNAIIAKAVLPNAPISIISNLCASNIDEMHDKAIDVLRSMQFIIEE